MIGNADHPVSPAFSLVRPEGWVRFQEFRATLLDELPTRGLTLLS